MKRILFVTLLVLVGCDVVSDEEGEDPIDQVIVVGYTKSIGVSDLCRNHIDPNADCDWVSTIIIEDKEVASYWSGRALRDRGGMYLELECDEQYEECPNGVYPHLAIAGFFSGHSEIHPVKVYGDSVSMDIWFYAPEFPLRNVVAKKGENLDLQIFIDPNTGICNGLTSDECAVKLNPDPTPSDQYSFYGFPQSPAR